MKLHDQDRRKWQFHTLEPVYDEQSQILILGTMPSPKSREKGFYYAHPQNRFWKTLAALAGQDTPSGKEERRDFLLKHRIALWDVLEQCLIAGASDSSIREPRPNDVAEIIRIAPIHTIYTTGRKATDLYRRLILPKTGHDCVYLPSPSPANQALSFEQLVAAYQEAFNAAGFDLCGTNAAESKRSVG